MEPLDSDHPKLAHEWKVYKSLASSPGIPRVFWFGTEQEYKAIVMSLLEPSLEDLFAACNRTFTLKTVLQLAQCLVLDYCVCLFSYTHLLLVDLTYRAHPPPPLCPSRHQARQFSYRNPSRFTQDLHH